MEELYIFEKQATEGTRPGLNLAIKQDGKTVGVIGITGRYDDIYSYGKIVKKMTEILLREKQKEDAGRILEEQEIDFLKNGYWKMGCINMDRSLSDGGLN